MVRLLVLYETPEEAEAFDRHYNEVHTPLARQLPGLLRYTVSRNISDTRGGKAIHLVAELDWENLEALQAAMVSKIGKEATADVLKFAPTGVTTVSYEVAEV
jgi:uncharacterized protein (TIGR02118 family)